MSEKSWWVWLDDEEGRYEEAGQVVASDERGAVERWANLMDLRTGVGYEVRIAEHPPTHDDDGKPWEVLGRIEYGANPRVRR
jgi:hypothetical protein